ncbi:MAG: polA [Bacillales bacterium]|jgi:DNA polymerase-1|nr:polA [Bacillales bacterium]
MIKKLVLIDGFSIAFRAFFAMPLLSNHKGIHTNAIYGFANMLNKILKDEQPTHALVAFDAGRTTFRHEFFEEYKGGRQQTPHELTEQFPFIREMLTAHGIEHYELENYEADDIIGTLARQAEQDGFEVKIVSGDRDLTQLATDKITVSITRKGLTETDDYTPEFVREKYNLEPLQIIDLKGLMGDTSDNIPGVPGVGEKTALKLLHEYGSVENVLNSTNAISGKKLVENLTTFRDQAILSKRLATIKTDTPLTIELDGIHYHGVNKEKLRAFYKEMGMKSFIARLDAELADVNIAFDLDGNGESTTSSQSAPIHDFSYEICSEMKPEMFTDRMTIFVEFFGENYFNSDVIGIGLASDKGCFYVPIDVATSCDLFKTWALDENKKKSAYDAKATIVVLRRHGIEMKGIEFDSILASYIINPSEKDDDVASVVRSFSDVPLKSDEDFYGKGVKKAVPDSEQLARFVAEKARILHDIVPKIVAALKDNSQYELLMNLELPLAVILADMEWTGVKVNATRLESMSSELQASLVEIESEIHTLAGEHFNIASPKQLGVILFEKLGIPSGKKTKTGYSTAADVLEELAPNYPIVEKILHYRQLSKLQSTYVEGLLRVIHEDGKVHTRFNQALTQTGRLSSIDPNLQNIPIRLEEGRKIREAFVPSVDGWKIFAADYSQIELRVLAHIAGDKGLVEAFQKGMDIHTKTAMDVFGVKAEEVTPNMRRQAKAVNFGIVYGISDFGLSQNLGITRREAASFIEKYFLNFPGVQDYMKDIVVDCRRNGYVETLLHRRRYIPDINNRNFSLRGFAERTAMNTPIQGSAADIIKLAMIRMQNRLLAEGLQAKMLLQVHDELIFECPESEIEILKVIVPEEMENAIELNVPLKADFAFGNTWYDAK